MATGTFDRVYDNTWQLIQIEDKGGPLVLRHQQGRTKPPAESQETSGGKKPRLNNRTKVTRELRDQHYERLQKDEYRAIRKKRKHTIEPGFGYLKEGLGFRQFSLRGTEKVEIEFNWVLLASNINTLNSKDIWVEPYNG